MGKIGIVLLEPEIPQNTGNIARTCAATGARLHLVEPMGFKVDDKKLKRAGLDYWYLLDITYYKDIDDFFERNKDGKFYYFSTKADKTYADIEYPDNAYLVFGKETAGLPRDFIAEHEDSAIRIPMSSDTRLRSLNLANSANIILFEALRQLNFPGLK
jgi:tRNA (cytidine/uridine-2'-O-)-methyltransferase